MTIMPEQAQELLEDTTPAPWEVETVPEMRYYDGETWEIPGKIVVYADEVTLFVAADEFVGDEGDEHDNEKNVRLAAAAPVMAAQIAGMQWEYAVEHQHIPGGEWHPVTRWSTEWPILGPQHPTPDERIVRRLVGEPEEID